MSLGASIAYRIGLEGAEEIKAKLDSVGQSGERAGQRMASGAREAKNPFEELSRSIEGVQRTAGGLLPSFRELAEVGTVAGFVELAKSAAESVRALENQARAFGMSTEELEKWKYAATQVGVSEESFVRGMQRFVAGLGQAREAEEKLRENAGLLVETQQLAESKASEARDAASQSADRAREAITRSNTAYQEAQLTLQRSTEAYDRLRQSTAGLARTIPIGTDATDKSLIAHQRLAEAQDTVDINTRRLAEAQHGIAAAIGAANLEQERQLNLSKQQALEQDKAARAAMKEQGGTLGAYQKLGLDPDQLGDTDQALQKTLAALEKIGDATQRAAIMKELWGKGWAESAALIQLNQADIEKLGLQLVGVTEEEKKFAEDFNKSWSRLSQTFEGVKNAVGNILGQALVPLFNGISDFFLHNAATIREWSSAAASSLSVFGQEIQVIGTLVKEFFSTMGQWIGTGLEAFNKLFGADVGVKDLVSFATALVGVATAFKAIRVAFLALDLVMGPWGAAIAVISVAVVALINHFDELKAAAQSVAKAIGDFLGIKPDSDYKSLSPTNPNLLHAAGGLIRGPGTGTSDSIPAWLSDGEYVVNAAATRMWLPVLRAINSSGSAIASALTAPVSRPNHFAAGGLVAAGAGGGLSDLPRELRNAGGFAAVNVRFEIAGHVFPANMQKQNADGLIKLAREQKLLSAGRQQSWKTE